MQAWWTRSCGVFGGDRPVKYRAGPNHDEAHVRAYADRDHILRNLLSPTHTRIVALGDDVD